jgi:hypothetical protein
MIIKFSIIRKGNKEELKLNQEHLNIRIIIFRL